MTYIDIEGAARANPVDVIEHIAALSDWSFERSADDEITISTHGSWCDYHVSFSWMPECEALHLACAFDLKVTDPRKTEVLRLLALVNERMLIGHFDLWTEESIIMYRHGLLLAGGVEPTVRQVEAMLDGALETCEQYYQAFQFVMWGGKSAAEALEVALFEVAGEA